MFDFASLRKQVSDLGSKAREAGAELERLKNEREEVAAAPTSRADAIAAMVRRIDAEGIKHLRLFSETLLPLVGKGDPARLNDSPLIAAAKPGTSATPQSLEAALCLVMGDQLKQAATKIIHAMQWPPGAIDDDERQKKLTALDRRIAESEAELSSLVIAARSAGINI